MRVVKHPPPRSSTELPTSVYLSTNTPFVSAIKRVKRNLDKTNRKRMGRYISVYGLGKAIQRALAVAMELQKQEYTVKIFTRTVYALDEHIDDEAGTSEMLKRPIGVIELRVYNKPS